MRSNQLRTVLAAALIVGLTGVAFSQNQAPVVIIQSVPTIVPPNTTVTLTATVSDDGLPAGSSISLNWCRLEGPGPVTFGTPDQLTTTATFDIAGMYVIELAASDGALTRRQTTSVQLNPVSNLPTAVASILTATGPGQDPLFSTRFLTMVTNALPLNATGAQYYNAIDPTNQKLTLDDFKTVNGFDSNPDLVSTIAESSDGCCSAAVFGNAGDLGFGRRMVMSRVGGDVSYFVTNYNTVEAAINEDPAELILTVAMEYSATPGASTNAPYVKFYMYDPAGNRITDVDFDGRGPKPVPLSCIVCHGGAYGVGGTIPPDGVMGAQYLPFDLANFDYSCIPGFSQTDQQAAFREFNEGMLDADISAATREVIHGWYGGVGLPSPTQNTSFVPVGWESDPMLYRQIVAPACRMCHLSRASSSLDFDDAADFTARQGQISGSLLFGPSPSGFRMPHAERTFERFWLSTTPHQPDVLAAAFQNGVYVGLGDPPGRVYVDVAAMGADDGSSWTDAYPTLDAALTDAAAPGSDITEIWVRAGTYVPETTGLADPRTATFALPDGVEIYGGFAGTETMLEQRDLSMNVTILSGDIAGDDMPIGVNIGENVYHVVTASGVSGATRLDGFEIEAGNASGAPIDEGGGMIAVNGSPLLVNVAFFRNFGMNGGGVAVHGGSPRFISSRFMGNNSVLDGGGLLARNGATIGCDSCEFSTNITTIGMSGDGGAIYGEGVDLRLTNCTFSRNYNYDLPRGGGVYLVNGGTTDVDNCIFWNNCSATNIMDEVSQIFADQTMAPVTLTVDYSIVLGLTGALGGTGNLGVDPLFIDEDGQDGIRGTLDDDLRLMLGSPAVDAGDNDVLPTDTHDLDLDTFLPETLPLDVFGMTRRFDASNVVDTGNGDAPIVDMGANEYVVGSLGDCGAGNVGVGMGGPFDVLTVNGTPGGLNRQVFAQTGSALTITMESAPYDPIAPFSLFLDVGAPTAGDVTPLPFGLGSFCFEPLGTGAFSTGGQILLADNIGLGIPPAVPSLPATTVVPWTLNVPALGPAELDFVLQGIIFDSAKPIPISVTNAVLVNVRENPPVNFKPVAIVADDNFAVFTNDPNVVLDGSGSMDPEGNAVTFQWTQMTGTAVTLSDDTAAAPTFTAPAAADTLTFELIVNDGLLDSDAVIVTVSVVSDTPIADAGPDQQVFTGSGTVTLDGTGSSDPNGQAITYCWTQMSGTPVTLSNKAAAMPTFTAPSASTTLIFQLEVSDGTNTSTPDTVEVRVLTSFVNDVYPIFSARGCTGCHPPDGGLDLSDIAANVYNNIVPARVDTSNLPSSASSSLILQKPLAVGAGGAAHGGGDIFMSTADPDYQTILQWIQDNVPDDT